MAWRQTIAWTSDYQYLCRHMTSQNPIVSTIVSWLHYGVCIYEFKKMKEGQYKTNVSCVDSKMKTSNTSYLNSVMWLYNGYLH